MCTLRTVQKCRHQVHLLPKNVVTARITTAVEVKTQTGVAEPPFGIIERRETPLLESVMEEKAAAAAAEPKNQAQGLGKNTWLFQLQLLRGHRAAAPPVLLCFSWLAGRNAAAGCRWLLLSVYSSLFLLLCINLSFPPSPAPPSIISWLYL